MSKLRRKSISWLYRLCKQAIIEYCLTKKSNFPGRRKAMMASYLNFERNNNILVTTWVQKRYTGRNNKIVKRLLVAPLHEDR